MNNKYFVTYEQAIALKKLGFEGECFYNYQNEYHVNCEDDVISEIVLTYKGGNYKTSTDAPTLEQAHAWIRDQGFLIVPYSMSFESWQYRICRKGKPFKESTLYEDFKSFEDALSFGISECLKIIKDEKK